MVDRYRDEDEPAPEPSRYGVFDGLQVVFAVMAGFGLFFYLQGPAKNPAHALFRLGIVAAGTVGLIVVTIIRLSRQQRR